MKKKIIFGKEKIFSKEIVAMLIVGTYVSLCKQYLPHESKEYKIRERLMKKLFNNYNGRIPRVVFTYNDIKNLGFFIGYSNKEKLNIFKQTIMYSGFTTVKYGKKEYHYFSW